MGLLNAGVEIFRQHEDIYYITRKKHLDFAQRSGICLYKTILVRSIKLYLYI